MYGHESCCDCTEDSRPGSFRLGDHCEAHFEQAALPNFLREDLGCNVAEITKPQVCSCGDCSDAAGDEGFCDHCWATCYRQGFADGRKPAWVERLALNAKDFTGQTGYVL